jgi:transketolase
MTEHQEIIPIEAEHATQESAGGRQDRWQRLLEELEQDADELRVRMHLAKAEAREEWDKLEERLSRFRENGATRRAAGEAIEDVEAAAKALWTEVRDGFDRVRKSLSD